MKMLKSILHWFLNAYALWVTPELVSSLHVEHYGSALLFALILGLINALIRPFFLLITLPITILSLGIFIFILNAFMFWLASGLVWGVSVPNFGSAFLAAFVYSFLTYLVDWALGQLPKSKLTHQ